MKRLIYILLFFFSASQLALACDVCGCGVGTSSFGVMPNFQGHFIGLKAQYGQFSAEHPPLFADSKITKSHESVYNVSLWTKLALSERLHIYIDLPYQSVLNTEDGITGQYSGLGDISLLANYFILNHTDFMEYDVLQSLQVGSGIKLPTGKRNITESDGYIIRSVQPGLGAFAVPLNVVYTAKKGRFGVLGEFNYQHYFKDADNYHYGDRFQQTAAVFMEISKENSTMVPIVGVNFAHANRDFDGKYAVNPSGGNTISAQLGYKVFLNTISAGIQAQIPVWQNNIGGYVHIRPQFQADFFYNF
jgi:hypothetical protein